MNPSPLNSFSALRERACALGPLRLAIAAAEDPVILNAAAEAAVAGLVLPILVGNPDRIRNSMPDAKTATILQNAEIVAAFDIVESAAIAVRLAATGQAHIILKGHLRTDQLLHAVLDKQHGLPHESLLSDVLIYEDTLSGTRRFVGVTDGGLNVAPNLEQKKQILRNAVVAFQRLGFTRPRVAVMSAIEIVSPAIPSTVDAQELTTMGQRGEFGECEVFGPLALDNALLESCARAKGISSAVAGRADIMLLPNLEAGNVLGKAVKHLGGSACGHVIIGSRVSILIPSRVESVEDKINSIAFGVVAYA